MDSLTEVKISLDFIREGLLLYINSRRPDTLFDAGASAAENHEARYQLVEGCFYDYEISDPGFMIGEVGENIVQPHKRNPHLGVIAPNIFVGTLELPVCEIETGKCHPIELEVQSIKAGYREDYRDMLEFITGKCTELLMQANAPASHYFEIDYTKDSQTLYQKFAFIKSVIGTDEFSEALHRVVTAPATKWTEISEGKDIRNVRRFSNANIKEIVKGSNRSGLPDGHYLKSHGLDSLPERITTIRKTDSTDTPENRFIKHALEVFLKFCNDIHKKAVESGHKKMEIESETLVGDLEGFLHHSFFKEISRPTTLRLNSPVLQRKEGYREVLRVWLMFDLAARLIWTGGDDIYKAGKKDVATLYEYWLFFQLLDLFHGIFKIAPKDTMDLIKETKDGLNLQLRQGRFTGLRGVYDSGSRKLNVRFFYNRSFTGKKNYPSSGSWTTTLRPDYSLSIWPSGISPLEAEKQELMVHVHFDAKYKVANLFEISEEKNEGELDKEKEENRKGIYKNADLLKMHAYKDAIRRTGGAYVLYPGEQSITQKGFHEIIPGLGAFPVRPSKSDSGIAELRAFVLELIEHFINRTTQREKLAYRTFDIHKDKPDPEAFVKDPLPESYNENRGLIPDETFVLVGFYKSAEHLEWIKNKKLYNFRIGTKSGSLVLDSETVSSRFLLLHTEGENDSGNLWRIVSKGPKVFSREDLLKKDYPSPSHDNYLVIEVAEVTDPEFKNVRWDFRKLKNYHKGRASGVPFTTSLVELMKNKV